jgi:hypothetical protein
LKFFELGRTHIETDMHPVLIEMSWESKKKLGEISSLCKPMWPLLRFPETELIYWKLVATNDLIESELQEAKERNRCLPKPSVIMNLVLNDLKQNNFKLLINEKIL